MSQRVPRYHKAGLALSDRCCFAHHITSLLNTAENGEVALCKVPGAPFPPPAALGVAARHRARREATSCYSQLRFVALGFRARNFHEASCTSASCACARCRSVGLVCQCGANVFRVSGIIAVAAQKALASFLHGAPPRHRLPPASRLCMRSCKTDAGSTPLPLGIALVPAGKSVRQKKVAHLTCAFFFFAHIADTAVWLTVQQCMATLVRVEAVRCCGPEQCTFNQKFGFWSCQDSGLGFRASAIGKIACFQNRCSYR